MADSIYETIRHAKHEFILKFHEEDQNIYTYIFTLWTWRKLLNTTLTVFIICVPWWTRPANAWYHCWNCPRGAECLATIVGLCWTESDYCILQHKHCGCYQFVGGNRLERSKFVSELLHFALISRGKKLPFRYYHLVPVLWCWWHAACMHVVLRRISMDGYNEILFDCIHL